MTVTKTTASNMNAAIDVSFATSSCNRPTGRTSRYRNVPALASPATASPATIATVIGRNTGRTSASAAAGNS